MEHHAAGSPPSVVEVVIEGTLEFEVIYEIRRRSQAPAATAGASSQVPLGQVTPTPKVRPVATIRPTAVHTKREGLTEEKNTKENLPDDSEASKDIQETITKSLTNPESKEPSFICDTYSFCDCDTGAAKIIVDENCNTIGKVPCVNQLSESISPQKERKIDQNQQTGGQTFIQQQISISRSNSAENQAKQVSGSCWVHRDWVRIASAANKKSTLKTFHISATKMECVNGVECHEGQQGYQNDQGYHVEKKPYQTTITECLEEFLENLHLGHLKDYLRVLGCTCVRDLRLLEQPELDAIQLISRRRLLEQLNSLNLHHEAPPADCSLEGWLTWYGLTHVSGFLQSIGVHSVADMSYLKEEDLQLLKPITRRRILACHRKPC